LEESHQHDSFEKEYLRHDHSMSGTLLSQRLFLQAELLFFMLDVQASSINRRGSILSLNSWRKEHPRVNLVDSMTIIQQMSSIVK
jgi:hypothetical protein